MNLLLLLLLLLLLIFFFIIIVILKETLHNVPLSESSPWALAPVLLGFFFEITPLEELEMKCKAPKIC